MTFLSCQIRDIEKFLHIFALMYPSIIDNIKSFGHYLLKSETVTIHFKNFLYIYSIVVADQWQFESVLIN